MRFLLTVSEPLDAQTGNVNAPQQLSQTWLDDTQTTFHVITQLGEGFSTCQVGLPSSQSMGAANPEMTRYGQQLGIPEPGWLPVTVSSLRQRAHIVITAGAFTVFEGRVTTIFPGPGGFPSGFLASGYGASATKDDYFTSSSTAATTSGAVVTTALQSAAPLIVAAPTNLFVDPSVAARLVDYTNMYPAQIISQVSKAGASGTLWDFLVYENRTATFQGRVAPVTPDYLIPFDARVQQAQLISDRMASQVTLRYTNSSSKTSATVTVTNGTFFAENGWHHVEFIQGGTMSVDAATAYASALLDLFAKPQFSATIIRKGQAIRDDALMPTSMGVETWSGQLRPPWLVRAGQWAQLSVDATTQDNVAIAGPHIIHRTEWDSHTGQLTMTIGTTIQDWIQVLATIGEHLTAIRAQLNPNTGGPQ